MSDDSKKPTPHIRTFAGDMEAARQRKSEQTESVTKPEKNTETIKGETQKTSVETKKPETHIPKPAMQKAATGIKPIPRAPHKIPAFHELNKKKVESTDTSKKAVPDNITVLGNTADSNAKNVTKVVRTDIDFDGKVLTDTKHNRFKLLPSAFSSIKNWFKQITTPKKKRVPKYTIPETSRRKGVIQKATSKTGSIFTADSQTLKEQIRRRRQEEEHREQNEAYERTHDGVTETMWSPYVETGFNLLGGAANKSDVIQNVQVEFKKHQVPVVEPIAEEVTPPEPVVSTVEDKVVETSPQNIDLQDEVDELIKPDATELTQETEEVSTELTPDDSEEDTEIISEKNSDQMDTNTLTVIILISIVAIVTIVFVGRVFVQYLSTSFSDNTGSATTSALEYSTLHTITLTAENINQLKSVINTQTEASDSTLNEFVVVAPGGTTISPSSIFDILNFTAAPALQSSLTSIRFITNEDAKNMMLLKFIDRNTVQGGLLMWESALLANLRSLFELPESTTTQFTDDVIAGNDVRILRDTNSNTILLYAIVNETTVIITTSETAFEQIISLEFAD